MTVEDIKRINISELIDEYVRRGYSWNAAIIKAYRDKADEDYNK